MEFAVFIWFGFSAVNAYIASSKKRSAFGWFMASVLLSPLISFLILLFMKNLKGTESDEEMTRCQYCKELIRRDAVKCKHCGSSIETNAAKA